MPELNANELEIYRLLEEARSQYERYVSTMELPPVQDSSNDDLGNYDWRHPVTIYTGGE
jgi:hypothetical protein